MPRQKKFEGPLARITADVPESLHKATCEAASKRKETIAQQVAAGLELRLSSISATTSVPKGEMPTGGSASQNVASPSAFSSKTFVLHQKLEDILNSQDQETIQAVVSNIEVFFDRLRPSGRPAQRRSRKSG